ncbi:MAG: eL32 family ribosomal protein [Nanoarchaeota archaeon]
MSKEFVRQDSSRFFKIGKKRKKYRVWRRPDGRDSKMRLRRKSYPASPTVGHRSSRADWGKIKGKTPVLIHNIKELELLRKEEIPILARVGSKKKMEIIKIAEQKNITLLNVGGNAK